ncbi:MAG: hypothetical protein FJZ66_07620 [Bacteroidetes bacterium]|nr:hypothetical protein [Bacteroidota bacterium]MBM3456279.1 hypothetical protein [Bacteroidota bacterium]
MKNREADIRKCGILRSVFYRWIKRFRIVGKNGLQDRSNVSTP